MIARLSGRRARHRGPAASVAAAMAAVAALAVPGVATATPPTPTITATQTGSLTTLLTSSTGTHWSWTFLNAAATVVGTSTLQNPLQAFPQAGDHTAILDATDDDPTATAPAHAQTTFHVYATPTANFTYTVLAGGTVQFTDTSAGEPTSWQWTFPGATSSLRNPPPRPIAPATPPPTVTLTVANPAGTHTVSLPVVVNGPPIARLVIAPNPTGANTPVRFDASTSTDPNRDALSYSWDLNGDQTYGDATGPVQTRAFAAPGTRRVGVRVSDGHGGTDTAVDFVTVLEDKPPAVAMSANPAEPALGATVTFTATASDPDGTVAAIQWDLDDDGQFDDGAGAVATWSFGTPGSRIVAVRATDNMGVATIAFRTINVTGSTGTQPPPGSAPYPTPAAAASRPGLMSPFPVVRIRGLIFKGFVRVNVLSVTAPKGARVKVVCHGRGCPKKALVRRVRSGKRPLRFRTLERRLRKGTVIELVITAPGQIGKYTRFAIRSNAAPARRDLCLPPGSSKPGACPAR
jgi:PKD repeat protein